MIHWIIKILQNFSVYKLGWYHEAFARVFDWQVVGITVLVLLSILTLANIIYFLAKMENYNLHWIYVPLCIFYIILNILIHFFLACLFLSLGPVMWIIFVCVYSVFISVQAGVTLDRYDDLPGFFGFAAFIVQYSKKYQRYVDHKEAMQEQYNRFLNIKYE